MQSITVQAHYDGTQILLDEPFPLEQDARLLITVISSPQREENDERRDWLALSLSGLQRPYDDDEPEYPLDALTVLDAINAHCEQIQPRQDSA